MLSTFLVHSSQKLTLSAFLDRFPDGGSVEYFAGDRSSVGDRGGALATELYGEKKHEKM